VRVANKLACARHECLTLWPTACDDRSSCVKGLRGCEAGRRAADQWRAHALRARAALRASRGRAPGVGPALPKAGGHAAAQDLDALGTLPKLTHLSLLDNEVTKQPNYRRAAVLGLSAAARGRFGGS